jgi:hypothetical protein
MIMEITIKNTTKIVKLNGVPARIWEGQTSTGIRVHCFITRIAIDKDESPENITQFAHELLEQEAPSEAIQLYSLNLII